MKTIFKTLFLTNLLLGINSLNAQTFEWVRGFGNTSYSYARISTTIDVLGNVYTTGTFSGTVDFDPGVGTTMLTSVGPVNNIFIQKMDASGNFLWAKSFGGTGMVSTGDITNIGPVINTDALGNVYTTGHFIGTADFDPGEDTFNLSSAGNSDVFVLKMDPSGNFLWAKSFGGPSYEYSTSNCVDDFGNIYTIGHFYGTADFNPDLSINVNLNSAGEEDIYVQKMDADGNFLWAKRFGGTSTDLAHSISVDNSGNIYTTGSFRSTVDFDPGPGMANLTATLTGNDIYVQKMDSSGNFLWVRKFGAPLDEYAYSNCVDALGNVYTTGTFRGTGDFNPGAGSANLTSAGNEDIYIQKLDASGNFLWAKRIGGSFPDKSYSICSDASGNIYTTGKFGETVDFDPGIGTYYLTSVADHDIFVQKMDASGNFLWARTFGGLSSDETGRSVRVDASGSIYTAGFFQGTVDFDPSSGVSSLNAADGDIFVQKMLPIGVYGYVFVDANENGIKDLGEITVPLQTINYNNGNDVAITNDDGFFRAFPEVGSQTFNLQLPTNYSNTTPISQIINVQVDVIDTLYFGIQPIPNVNDLVVEIHPYTSPRPGFTRNYQVSYQNVGTTTLNEVTLKFLKSEEDNVVFATGTYTVSNDTLIWNIGTLASFSYGSVTITNTLSATATLGDSTLTQAWIIPSADDATTENNVVALSEGIIGSYDPNDKTVTPEVSEPTENEPLEYVVRFQNTGNHQADFVIVRDTLSTLLDLTTFQMIAASHSYELAIENRIAVWTFPQINLPDSTSNEPGSHGFIKFKVQRVDGLGLGTQIPNRVGIYFDYNAPVITNTCIYSIETCISSTGTDVITACNNYTWIDGNTYTASNNIATYTIDNAAGCDSIVTLNLTINTVTNIGTTLNGTTITANNNNATYQWLDCDNNDEPIEGATNQTFTATESGNYAVELTENGCTNTSACVAVTVIGIDELSNGLQALVYPNPSQGNVEITLGSTMQDVELMLTDIQGRVIFTRNYPSLFKTNIELPDAKGVYILKLKAQDSTSTLRIIKE